MTSLKVFLLSNNQDTILIHEKDIARDDNVDLIVVSVKAALHHATIVPAILAGKDIYVEWPLAATVTEATELYELSLKHNTKLAIVGLQGRSSVIKALKEVTDSERVGKVLSSTFMSQAQYGRGTVVKGFEYSTNIKAGAGLVNIFFGHMVDMIQLGMSHIPFTDFANVTDAGCDMKYLENLR